MKAFHLSLILSLACLGLGFASQAPLSSGAPMASTDAPNEGSCAKSGCHVAPDGSLSNLNSGNGQLNLQTSSPNQNYQAGHTYQITVSLQQQDIQRFGFALTVLGEDELPLGELKVLDPIRTQIFQGRRQFAGRQYMTYRFAGTEPTSPNLSTWTFEWQAPNQNLGKAHFYLAAVAADNDGTDLGDEVYTLHYTLDN